MVRECLSLSYSFRCGFFFSFAQYVGVTQLVSGFLSERISQCVGVDLVCLSEESSGVFCVAILRQNPGILFVCL